MPDVSGGNAGFSCMHTIIFPKKEANIQGFAHLLLHNYFIESLDFQYWVMF